MEAKYDAFFAALDSAELAEGTALTSDGSKQWLETSLLRALARASAAQYHLNRLREKIRKIHARKDELVKSMEADPMTGLGPIAVARVQMRRPVDPIAFELEAFLAAARSSIDFTAQALAKFIKGIKHVRSITALRDMAKRGPGEPFAPFITKWDAWIGALKDYRDQFTHLRTLRGESGYRVTRRGPKVCGVAIPFVIPEAPIEKDEPDTRLTRMLFEDELSRVDVTSSHGLVTHPDGTTEVLEMSEEMTPTAGYVEVSTFCQRHLDQLRGFIAEAMEEMKATNFKLLKQTHGSGKKAK